MTLQTDNLSQTIDDKLFIPLTRFIADNFEADALENMISELVKKNYKDKLNNVKDYGNYKGLLIEACVKEVITQFAEKRDDFFQQTPKYEIKDEYLIQTDETGNIKIYDVKGDTLTEIDSLYLFGDKSKVPVIFEISYRVGSGAGANFKSKLVESTYGSIPYYCKIRSPKKKHLFIQPCSLLS